MFNSIAIKFTLSIVFLFNILKTFYKIYLQTFSLRLPLERNATQPKKYVAAVEIWDISANKILRSYSKYVLAIGTRFYDCQTGY